MTLEFSQLIEQLCKPFPNSIKKLRQDGRGTYIPISFYIERLNEVAGQHWSHERVGDPLFYQDDRFVHTMVKVTICGRSHFGEGFSRYQVDEKTGKIINRHYSIRSATKDGIRDAISFFGMDGTSSHISSQSVKLQAQIDKTNKKQARSCVKCDRELNQSEIDVLDSLHIKFNYCAKHIPKHLNKKS